MIPTDLIRRLRFIYPFPVLLTEVGRRGCRGGIGGAREGHLVRISPTGYGGEICIPWGDTRLVKVSATEEIAAVTADQLAAAVFKARGAGGAEAGVMLGGQWTLGGCGVFGGCCRVRCGLGR